MSSPLIDRSQQGHHGNVPETNSGFTRSFGSTASTDLPTTSASTRSSELSDQIDDQQLPQFQHHDRSGDEESRTTRGQSDRELDEYQIKTKLKKGLSEGAKLQDSLLSNIGKCVYQVPPGLKKGNEEACNPQVVDLALYRRVKHRQVLQIGDADKSRAASNVLRLSDNNTKRYVTTVKNLEKRSRACYEEAIPSNGTESIPVPEGHEFIERINLNGSFVIEMLLCSSRGFESHGYDEDDLVFSDANFNSIQQDMIKMENQIPLFVLDAIMGFHLNHENHEGVTASLITRFFNSLMPQDSQTNGPNQVIPRLEETTATPTEQSEAPPAEQSDDASPAQQSNATIAEQSNDGENDVSPAQQNNAPLAEQSNDASPAQQQNSAPLAEQSNDASPALQSDSPSYVAFHCLDVCRQYLLRGLPDMDLRRVGGPLSTQRRMQLIPCARLLRDAGFTLKRINTDCLLDIKFKKGILGIWGTLQIPHLEINDGTKSLLLNLIAFEQRRPGRSRPFTSYVNFIDSLIRSTEDVDFLRYCGIINHSIGSDDEVLKLLHSLLQDVVYDREICYLKKLSQEVSRHYNSGWSAFRGWLIQYSKTNPWFVIISLVVGIMGLLLSFSNVFYAIFGHHAKATNAR